MPYGESQARTKTDTQHGSACLELPRHTTLVPPSDHSMLRQTHSKQLKRRFQQLNELSKAQAAFLQTNPI